MARAYLALGANLGDPAAQLAEAIARLEDIETIDVVARSSVIATRPWGKTDQPDFLNQVVGIETALKPMALLEACLAVETAMGRVRQEVWGPRLIDIDLIAYEDYEVKSARLTLPHPYAHQRDFVLGPLREIAPEVAERVVRMAERPR